METKLVIGYTSAGDEVFLNAFMCRIVAHDRESVSIVNKGIGYTMPAQVVSHLLFK